MEIKDQLDKIRQEVGEETASKISASLNSIEYAFNDLAGQRTSLDQARVKYRDRSKEQEDELENLKQKIEELSNDNTVTTLTEENEKLKSFRDQIYEQNRNKFNNSFDDITASPNFDKIQKFLKLGSYDEKENKYDNAKLTDEDILHNNNKIEEFRDLGLFEKENKNRQHIPPGKPPAGELPGETDIAKLARENPKEAARILEEQGLGDRKVSDAYLK